MKNCNFVVYYTTPFGLSLVLALSGFHSSFEFQIETSKMYTPFLIGVFFNDMDHMSILRTEPSSVILSQTCSIKSWKVMTNTCQNKLKQKGWCNKPTKRKRKKSDSVLWQKPLHGQKNQKSKVTTQKQHQKWWWHNDCGLGRSVGVTIATQLVRFNWFSGSQPSQTDPNLPTNHKSRVI